MLMLVRRVDVMQGSLESRSMLLLLTGCLPSCRRWLASCRSPTTCCGWPLRVVLSRALHALLTCRCNLPVPLSRRKVAVASLWSVSTPVIVAACKSQD